MPIVNGPGSSAGGSSGGAGADGWTSTSVGLTYSSADAPTFVITTASDLSGTIPVGARIKLTQTTVKYFIVTAIDAATMTVYGGTDYTLINAAISAPSYSVARVPFGFPADPAKWSVDATNATSQSAKASPVASTWYGETGLSATGPSIVIPIGCWRVFYDTTVDVSRAANGSVEVRVTLSTANNTQSDTSMTALINTGVTATRHIGPAHRERSLTIAAKTSYFLNIMTTVASMTSIDQRGDISPTVVRAVCAYL